MSKPAILLSIADSLLQQAKKGDLAAFEAIAWKYERPIYNLCCRLLLNAEDAKDAAQETFVRLFGNLGGIHSDAHLKNWLYMVANNICVDAVRKRKTNQTEAMDESLEIEDGAAPRQYASEEPGPEEALLVKIRAEGLAEAVASLPYEQRRLILLRDVEGFSYKEIAEITGLELGTVKSGISRARDKLKNIVLKMREQNRI